MVAEVESTNEAERFEEVTRIVFAEVDKPYDVLGVNWKASFDNIKKRYWKLSLTVHPDKCSHPQAHQAFVILNQAFKDLKDADKRKAIDEKIKLKEEQEAFQAELKVLREAAQWRRLQGISLEGDEELLAFPKEEPKTQRDEWMTELPPERKPGMPVQSTSFSKSGKEGRGDTSMWTDTPLDKARQAKQKSLCENKRARRRRPPKPIQKLRRRRPSRRIQLQKTLKISGSEAPGRNPEAQKEDEGEGRMARRSSMEAMGSREGSVCRAPEGHS